MSARELLGMQYAYAEDPAVGLAARATALRDQTESGPLIETERLTQRRWVFSADGTAATADEYAITPVAGAVELQQPNETDHVANYDFTLALQTWRGDPAVIEDTIAVYEAAVRRWLAGMLAYSNAHAEYGRTLQLVQPLIRFDSFADFPGLTATSAGLLCTYTLTERSSE